MYTFVNLESAASRRAVYVRASDVVALITEDGDETTAVLSSGERVTGARSFAEVLGAFSAAAATDGA